jgi:DegV family protein with EDD domain
MKNVAVVTDTACCLPSELIQRYDIHQVPLYVIYQGKSYRDKIDITPDKIYKIMRAKKDLPSTSVPSPEDFLEAYRQMKQKAKSILCITVTSLQSGVFNMAFTAKQMAKEAMPDTIIEVLDSRAVAGSLGFIVLEAARKASEGAELAKVKEAAQNIMNKVSFFGMLDTLYYLARTGRIARAAAWAGSLVNVKPIVGHFPGVGETTPVARPRSRAKGLELMLEMMAERIGDSRAHIMIQHADEPEEAEILKATVASRFNCTELLLAEFPSGMGVHCGPGLLAASFYTD